MIFKITLKKIRYNTTKRWYREEIKFMNKFQKIIYTLRNRKFALWPTLLIDGSFVWLEFVDKNSIPRYSKTVRRITDEDGMKSFPRPRKIGTLE